VTVGCIPITDQQIDELYIIAAHAKDQGQDFIPVHIFPVRFNVERSVKFLDNLTKDDPSLKKFADRMEDAFDYFEKYKQQPIVMIGDKGEYLINDVPPKRAKGEKPAVVKKAAVPHRTRTITNLAEVVNQWPQFPGGGEAFMKYLDQLGKDVANLLPNDVKKAYIQLEFIVDSDGTPTNFKVLKGLKDDEEGLHDELINRLENMGTWKPALVQDKPVAKKMIQTVTVGE
jgi:hypothetical protein